MHPALIWQGFTAASRSFEVLKIPLQPAKLLKIVISQTIIGLRVYGSAVSEYTPLCSKNYKALKWVFGG